MGSLEAQVSIEYFSYFLYAVIWQFGNLGINFIGMNGGGGNEADNLHSMTQTMAQQQQQQVESDMTATSFSQHLGQLPGGSVDQLTVNNSLIC